MADGMPRGKASQQRRPSVSPNPWQIMQNGDAILTSCAVCDGLMQHKARATWLTKQADRVERRRSLLEAMKLSETVSVSHGANNKGPRAGPWARLRKKTKGPRRPAPRAGPRRNKMET